MSLERAYINCQRCYEIAKPHMDQLHQYNDEEEVTREMVENDQLYVARNDAMKALETIVNHIDNMPLELRNSDFNKYGIGNKRALASNSLEACKGCDYKSPAIIDFLNGDTE